MTSIIKNKISWPHGYVLEEIVYDEEYPRFVLWNEGGQVVGVYNNEITVEDYLQDLEDKLVFQTLNFKREFDKFNKEVK